MRISITGTPGTGKTTLCDFTNWEVESVMSLARNASCVGSLDPTDGAMPVDVEKLVSVLHKSWSDVGNPILIDGHLSHYLPVNAIVVLRCHPETLRERLVIRDYSSIKIDENVESEFIGVISTECFEKKGIPTLEIDTSVIRIEDAFSIIEGWVADGFKPMRPEQPIDWITIIHDGD
ncbi:MAG: AAA family ATPase [Candidatus Thalassarchaeaceae archaeon]|jgi:adenylate kinase|nr:AAA family ATPase [Candidatus Thalassarchaeaceae archaeon]